MNQRFIFIFLLTLLRRKLMRPFLILIILLPFVLLLDFSSMKFLSKDLLQCWFLSPLLLLTLFCTEVFKLDQLYYVLQVWRLRRWIFMWEGFNVFLQFGKTWKTCTANSINTRFLSRNYIWEYWVDLSMGYRCFQ